MDNDLMPSGYFFKEKANNYCKDGYLMIPLKDILHLKMNEDGMLCTDKQPTIELHIKMLKQYY